MARILVRHIHRVFSRTLWVRVCDGDVLIPVANAARYRTGDLIACTVMRTKGSATIHRGMLPVHMRALVGLVTVAACAWVTFT